jgi:hypothetical protein
MNRKSHDPKPKPEGIDELEALFQEAGELMDRAEVGAGILEEAKRRLQEGVKPPPIPRRRHGDAPNGVRPPAVPGQCQ